MVSSGKEVSNVGFQHHGGELGISDGREGFRLVTITGRSCLGVAGRGTSVMGKTIGRQLLRGKKGGL